MNALGARKLHGARQALVAALALAAVSTVGDLIWALFIPEHQVVFGVAHGALLCMILGVVLGLLAGSWRAALQGAAGALVIGLVVSGGFYLLHGGLGMAAMFVCWMLLWLLTSVLNGRLRRSTEGLGLTLLRGAAAAVLSGLAFHAISGIWLEPDPDGPNYAYHFAAWTFAFLPGFLALLLGTPNRP